MLQEAEARKSKEAKEQEETGQEKASESDTPSKGNTPKQLEKKGLCFVMLFDNEYD